MNKRVELLSPAGDLERLKIALIYGADAVYIGGKSFSLRANAKNASTEDIEEGCRFAHSLNKKIYVTINMIFHEEDFDLINLKAYIKELCDIKVDGLIVADLMLIDIIREISNSIEIHISTQQSTLNYKSLKLYEKLGVQRVVLGRETSRSDLITIKENTTIDIETFIHGAMCTSYSGRCVLSNYLTNRDSNRGGCSQICRWSFDLLDDNKKEMQLEKKFEMCIKDLNMATYVHELIELGITSLKVEGRMRSMYYIATVMYVYRKIIDSYYNNFKNDEYIKKYIAILDRCSNRDSAVQYYDKMPGVFEQYYIERKEVTNQDFKAMVVSYDKNTKIAEVIQKNFFQVGDEVVVFGPDTDEFLFRIDEIIDNNNDKRITANHPEELLNIKIEKEVKPNDIIRVKFDNID